MDKVLPVWILIKFSNKQHRGAQPALGAIHVVSVAALELDLGHGWIIAVNADNDAHLAADLLGGLLVESLLSL